MFKFGILISTLDAVKMPGSHKAIGKSFDLKGGVLGRLPGFGYYSMEDIMEKVIAKLVEHFGIIWEMNCRDIIRTWKILPDDDPKYGIAMTRAVWNKCVDVHGHGVEGDENLDRHIDRRFRAVIRRHCLVWSKEGKRVIHYEVGVGNDNGMYCMVKLKCIICPSFREPFKEWIHVICLEDEPCPYELV